MSSYESQRSNSSARTMVAAGAVLALVVVAWLVLRSSEPASLPQPTIAQLRSELAAVRVPAGTTAAGPAEETVKIGSLLLTGRYVLQQPDADARGQLRADLVAHGWQYQSGTDGQTWIDNYCKAPLAAKVEPVTDATAASMIALSFYWNETTILKCGSGAKQADQ